MPTLVDSLIQLEAVTAALPRGSATFAELDEADLLRVPVLFANIHRNIESSAAGAAGEIARRSTREQGLGGLAQRTGFRTPEKLVQNLTGSTGREAATLVRTGIIIHEAEIVTESERTGEVPPELTQPWLAAVGRAVAAGTLSIEASEAIRIGLGTPNEDITADVLAGAAAKLVQDGDAANPNALDADQLLIRARAARDELDEAGIIDRERAQRNARSLRRYRRQDGMTVYNLLADPENAAYLDGMYDAMTSPRRGGPRMVDPEEKARAEEIEADPRTTEQFSFDGFMAIFRIGACTDEKTAARSVLGSRRPAVRVLVTKTALSNRAGHGRIEGHDAPVSIETVERIVCGSGTISVGFDPEGQVIDLGREQRLFSASQRIALAARDGGCCWIGCDSPASWAEAHHIFQWKRDKGNTDIADGILLCRHHHLLLHDNHWEIIREGGTYWLIPPPNIDSNQTPRLMPSKSAALGDLQREYREKQESRKQRDIATQAIPKQRGTATRRGPSTLGLRIRAANQTRRQPIRRTG